MKNAMFDTRSYDRAAFEIANTRFKHEITFLEPRLTRETATLAAGHQAVCPFVNDRLDELALETLRDSGARLIALRSAGYNHVDLAAAARLGLPVVRVPEYSPFAVAEHAAALVLSLNRKIHRAPRPFQDPRSTSSLIMQGLRSTSPFLRDILYVSRHAA